MKHRLVISIPTIDGHVSGWTMASVLGLYPNPRYLEKINAALDEGFPGVEEARRLMKKAYDVQILDTWNSNRDLVRTRSRAVYDFLKTDGTHLFFLDADVAFEPATIRTLLDLDLPIVSLPYPKRHIHWARAVQAMRDGENPIDYAYNYVLCTEKNATSDERGVLECTGTGMGATLIRRDVLEKMVAHYAPEKTHPEKNEKTGEWENVVYLFELMWGEKDGKPHYWGEDLSFCLRWRALGGKLYFYVRSVAHHFGNHLYQGTVQGLVNQRETLPEDRI